jgi:endogenous inhibitor of DNA gyrase (YacG/DUF329 family)
MIKVECPKCKKQTTYNQLNLLHNDWKFWCCQHCKHIPGKAPKILEGKL